jgi:N-acetylneuraminate lyase
MPFYYHHVPALNGIGFPITEALVEARKISPNIVGSKYNDTDMLGLSNMLNHGFKIYIGGEGNLIAAMALGASGSIGAAVNLSGKTFDAIY